MFKKEELRLLWPFYLYCFIANMFGIGSLIWTVYFVQKGFSFTEVGIGMAVLIGTTLFFEVPTGAVADIFGRKVSVSLGYVLFIIFAALIPFANKFFVLILLFILMGIAITFISGAETAWVIDYLKKQKKKELIQDYFSKIYSISSAGVLLAGLFLTGILLVFKTDQIYFFLGRAFLGSDLVWFVQAAGMAAVLLIMLLFTKEEFKRKKQKIHLQLFGVFKYSKKSASYVWNHPILFSIFASIFFMGLFIGILGFAYQPLLLEFGFEMKDIGWTRSIAEIFGIMLPLAAKFVVDKYKNHLKIIRWSFILDFIVTASIIFIAGPIAGLIYYILVTDFGHFIYPILDPYVQENTPSKTRATITSMQSMVLAVGGIISSLIAGPMVDFFGAKKTMFVSAFILIPIIWIYFKIKKEKHGK